MKVITGVVVAVVSSIATVILWGSERFQRHCPHCAKPDQHYPGEELMFEEPHNWTGSLGMR